MELSPDVFSALLSLDVEGQGKVLEEQDFDMMTECDEYVGKIIDENEWRNPEIEILRNFFESTLDDPDERMELYEKELKLSDDERNEFKEYLINEALENEYHPGLFSGILTCDDDSLVVVSERIGGAWDCEAKFVGVYEDIKQDISSIGGATGQLID
jgi:hypothetical protein